MFIPRRGIQNPGDINKHYQRWYYEASNDRYLPNPGVVDCQDK